MENLTICFLVAFMPLPYPSKCRHISISFIPGLQPLGWTFQEECRRWVISEQRLPPVASPERPVERALRVARAAQLQTRSRRLPAGVRGVDNLSDARPSCRCGVDSGCHPQDAAAVHEAARLGWGQNALSIRWRSIKEIWQDVFVPGWRSLGGESYSGYSVRNVRWMARFHRIWCTC